jgi:AraC-like DNA-binding protein
MANEYELINHLRIKYMNIFLVQLKYRTPHYHNEMELGLILRGTLNVKKSGNSYILYEKDIFVLNPRETHELYSEDEDVLILSVQLSSKLFSSYFPQIKALQFLDFNLRDTLPESIYLEVLSYLQTLAFTYFKQEPLFKFQCMIIANQLMYQLLHTIAYKILTAAEQEALSSRIGRLKRVIDYVEENYSRKLLLQEIADSEQLSLTYLSHFIKDLLGMSFQDYLNHVRLEHAVHMIETTDQNMLDISLESGFSDIRYLNKLFTLRYGCTPKNYRKNNNKKSEATNHFITSLQRILSPEESLELLLLLGISPTN